MVPLPPVSLSVPTDIVVKVVGIDANVEKSVGIASTVLDITGDNMESVAMLEVDSLSDGEAVPVEVTFCMELEVMRLGMAVAVPSMGMLLFVGSASTFVPLFVLTMPDVTVAIAVVGLVSVIIVV